MAGLVGCLGFIILLVIAGVAMEFLLSAPFVAIAAVDDGWLGVFAALALMAALGYSWRRR